MATNKHKDDMRVSVVFTRKSGSQATTKKRSNSTNNASGKGTKNEVLLVRMMLSTAKEIGAKIANNADTVETKVGDKKGGAVRRKTGGFNGGSMKIEAKGKSKSGIVSVPVPSGATISDMLSFAESLSIKPRFFITPLGVRYDVSKNIPEAGKK